MEQTQKFKLIAGEYTPAEAREVLLALINSKINFNHMAAFGLEERAGHVAGHHRKRIAELKEVRAAVSQLLEQAQELGCRLAVSGSFSLTLIPDPTVAVQPDPGPASKQDHQGEPGYYLA